jgi:hypothetical protein
MGQRFGFMGDSKITQADSQYGKISIRETGACTIKHYKSLIYWKLTIETIFVDKLLRFNQDTKRENISSVNNFI